jgi:ZIP family zinc transporter
MTDAGIAMLHATFAGATIPLGGFLARVERIRPAWLQNELRHSVIAFGGGVLIAAIALVLVPEGMHFLSEIPAVAAFGAGGLVFFALDRAVQLRGGSASQFMAMLIDFVPESMALGALLTTSRSSGVLLALLIALQNFPEGFNAYREMRSTGRISSASILAGFSAIILLGPLAAWIGFAFLQSAQGVLGAVMLFASGGILYLTFQDIAPQARIEREWGPALGAVAGFMLGLLGHVSVN